MPVHDWSRVVSGNFHDFHQRWIVAISSKLNAGLLPEGYYALAEQHASGPIPDVLALETDAADDVNSEWGNGGGTMLAVETHPPKVSYTEQMERDIYAEKADRVAVYHANGDRVVAYMEIVSRGNKHTEAALRDFFQKMDDALEKGCHLLIIDLHRPGKHDPQGLHHTFWDPRHGDAHGVSKQKPFGLSAYRISLIDERTMPIAYFEPVAFEQELPDMPLFLTPRHYINVPLESTYREAWKGVPGRWKRVIEDSDGK